MPYGTVNADSLVSSDGGVISPNINSLRNRIINGAMVIDQRNAGASVTTGYPVDRFFTQYSSGTLTLQQSSSVVPSGFSNSLGITVTSAGTRNAGDFFGLLQIVEGFNIADLNGGLANAQTFTLSFWVRSSIAGSYSGAVRSGDNYRTYIFAYTISSANTWEYKTVTITGDTSGGTTAYPINNSAGLRLCFDLGTGSTYQQTAGSWQANANRFGASGTVSWAQTAGATFYITGVQLEKGSVATSFDYRPYGTELALCQRYFEIVGATPNSVLFQTYAGGATSGNQRSTFYYKATKRTSPTVTVVGTWSYSNAANLVVAAAGADATRVEWDATAGGINFAYNQNAGSYLTISAEL